MATFVVLRHPVITLVTDFINPDNLMNDLLNSNSLKISKSLVSRYVYKCDNKINQVIVTSNTKV